jgi:hypothetical protein
MAYYVYHNWTKHKARIHLGDCSWCNFGEGIHLGAGTENCEWLGPFRTFQEALGVADRTGEPVTPCKHCNPSRDTATTPRDST